MKSYFKSKILVVLILLLLISVNIALFQQMPYSEVNNQPFKDKNPKLNAPDIVIITPENKTYTGPMSGYYTAPYGFENDINGNDPQEWNDTSGTGCDCYVVDSTDDHNKVLKLYDNSAFNRADIEVSLPYQTNGTIEYWVYGSMSGSPYDRFYSYIYDGGNAAIQVITTDGIWYYGQRGGGWVALPGLPNIQAGTWQHIRIHFEMGNSGYMGLGPDQFELIVDGVNSGALDTAMVGSGIDKDRFFTITEDVIQNWYIDAFGYTGEVDYNIGKNKKEGLLLGFENSTSLDWMVYSLDGQVNKTILGNFTFPIQSEGLHSIQVFGNDTLGTMHQSSLRYFSIKAIFIITPENKTYTGSMSSYYPGTYGFEDKSDGVSGTNIDFIDTDNSDANCISTIIGVEDGHKKVIEFYDNNGAGEVEIYNDFTSAQTYGTIDYWFKISDATYTNVFFLFDATDYLFAFRIDADQFQYHDGSYHNVGLVPRDDTWYHITINFECTTGGYMGLAQYDWNVFINGNKYGDYDFSNNKASATKFRVSTSPADSGYYCHLDAVGYSWDPNYNVGDNLNEGLLLSFENSTNLDWIGYSLDGQVNKTILGNTTIPLPVDGLHTIQVFGSNTLGTLFESDVRYFSVKFIQINLITPENLTYTEPMSGYYPATYGFENDINGNDPQEWNDISGTGCDCYVVDSAGDHNKVLKLYDNSDPNRAEIEVSLPYQTKGTIEYWVYGSMSGSPYDRLYEYIFDGGNAVIQVITVEGTWSYGQRGGGWVLLPGLPNLQAGKWQHIRIHFEMGSSGYMGLGSDQFEFIIDGVSSGVLDTAMVGGGIDKNKFFTITDDVGQNWYIDAFGYTGDVYYNIGDNLNEGILLSLENSSILDWIGYSLDGQANKTISGNTTIPMPENGLHTIQIFGSISEGFIYESDIVHFTINIAEDQTPPNGSEDINYILIITLIGILSLIGIVVVAIIYSRVHVPSEKPKSKRRKIKESKEKDISMELTHCPFCHSEIISSQKFCNYCGSNLKDDSLV